MKAQSRAVLGTKGGIGKRIYPENGGLLFKNPGEYGKHPRDGNWYAAVPTPQLMVGSLAAHDVTEHEDGTITVSPSILVRNLDGTSWHGHLERGVWREA